MSLTYRTATPADISEIGTLRGAEEAGGTSPERMARYLAGRHHPQKALKPRVMYLALEDGRIVGYVAGHLTRRYECDGELQWIYVREEMRGRGIAAELLSMLASWFVDRQALRVCVDVGAPEAARFYTRHGARTLDGPWMVWDDVSVAADKRPA
jgi:GNAT superfamily N-acetyltransferase